MLEAPKNGDPKSTTKNNKEYHWCPKCAKGVGQWVYNKPSDYLDNFKPKKKILTNGGLTDSSSKKKEKKTYVTLGGGSSSNSGNSL